MFHCAINLIRRDDLLFYHPVRDHYCDIPVEEVQDPVMNAAKAAPEFVHCVAQVGCFESAEVR